MRNDAVTASATTESRAGVVSSVVGFTTAANAAGPAGVAFVAAVARSGVAFAAAGAVELTYVGVVAVGLDGAGL